MAGQSENQAGRDPARPAGPRGILVVAGVVAAFTALSALNQTVAWFDDPYFYLQIARNMLAGEGATFHGLGWTNGYHPLWLLVVTPMVALAEGTGLSAPSVVMVGQAVLALASGIGLLALMRRAELPYPALALSLAAVVLLGGGLWGSEGWLAVALQVAGLALWLDALGDRESPARWAAAGAVLGLAVLARLDLVLLAAAVCFVTALRREGTVSERLREALWLGGALTAVLLPYLAVNLIATGHLMPVSGAVKSTFPLPDLDGVVAKLGVTGRNAVLGGLLALGVGASRSGRARALFVALGFGALAHAAYVGLFTGSRWSTDYDYYWTTGALALSLSAAALYAGLTRFLPSLDAAARGRLAAVLGMLLIGLGLARVGARALEPVPSTVRLAGWMGAHLPEDAIVFTADAPGRLAWFSGRRVFAVDGLTWDFALSETLRARGGDRWLDERGATHVVAPLFDYDVPWLRAATAPGGVVVTLRDPWTREDVGVLSLRTDDALVVTTTLGAAPDEVVGVWRR